MRTLVICLLAVGALATESTKRVSLNKHVKRGSLMNGHGSNVYKGEQFGQQLVRYTQPGYQHVTQTGPLPAYTSDLTYQAGSLPLENQHQSGLTDISDNQLSKILLRQYDHSTDFQQQQVAQEVDRYSDSVGTDSRNSLATFANDLVNVPVPVSHQVPVTRTVQVLPQQLPLEVTRSFQNSPQQPETAYRTKTYQVNVDDSGFPISLEQPLEVEHPAQLPQNLDAGQQLLGSSVQQQDHTSFEPAAAVLGNLGLGPNVPSLSYEHVNVQGQQHHFREKEIPAGVVAFENSFPSAYKIVTHERQGQQPAGVLPSVIGDQSLGYRYDQPSQKFTF